MMASQNLDRRSACRVLIALGLVLFIFTRPGLAQPPNAVIDVLDFSLSNAVGLAHAGDGSGRLFVVQKSGEIRIWDGDEILVTPFLDLSALVSGGFEQGLLGLAFHPDYAVNGLFYVDYTDTDGNTVVARFSVSAGNANIANPASAWVVLRIPQNYTNHNGGDLHFGPDGYLYISTGDDDAPSCNAQDLSILLGKILRIDVDVDAFPADADRNYGIPADNPFVSVAGAAGEIWSLGLRNPWRFSFDRLTGDMWIGDVGDSAWEEVDFEPAGSAGGENYGWPWFEGEATASGGCAAPTGAPFSTCDDADAGFTCPVLTQMWEVGVTCSMIGGYRYRGSTYPAFEGLYFHIDWCRGVLWAAEDQAGTWVSYTVASPGGFSGFGEDESGELYMVGGSRLAQITDPLLTLFTDGFESGDTVRWSSTSP